MASDLQFQIEDYVILSFILLVSAAAGLYVSLVKHKQTSLKEYFLAGNNVATCLILLSFFSTFAAGGMMNLSIEIYAFGSQSILPFLLLIPLNSIWLYFFAVPVFHQLQTIDTLKYFEIRFGTKVHTAVTIANVLNMVMIGAVNLYVAAIAIEQVSALSFWIAASSMVVVCIIYSSLGGMRGILLADTIQALMIIISVCIIFGMGVHKSGITNIWKINSQYNRLEFFNFSLNPTIRHTVWSSIFGTVFYLFGLASTNQALIQRCVIAPILQTAQRVATTASAMTLIYCVTIQALGLVIFAFYKGCNLVQTGVINSINQIIPHYAMEVLHEYPGLPGIFFSGVLCATLSTISSLLNSISALLTSRFHYRCCKFSERTSTYISKLLVIIFGVLMTLGLLLMERFQNIVQAAITATSTIVGPTFALLCLGFFCPQINRDYIHWTYCCGLLYGFWLMIGTVVTSFRDPPFPFATCNSTIGITNTTVDFHSDTQSFIDQLFPMVRLSYDYIHLQGFVVTTVLTILASIIASFSTNKEVSKFPINLIPPCVQSIQLRMSRRLRRVLLCDVYDDVKDPTELALQETSKFSEESPALLDKNWKN